RESGGASGSLPPEDQGLVEDALAKAMEALPDDQRSVVHLKLVEGLTFEEISRAQGIPLNTAASRYRYALDKLRSCLRPLYKELS
ncbi:MAG: RNA polymerase sigma factor, partial [Verrucomicrobiales bacterium]